MRRRFCSGGVVARTKVRVSEAGSSKLDPEVTLKRCEVFDRHQQRRVVRRVHAEAGGARDDKVSLDRRESYEHYLSRLA